MDTKITGLIIVNQQGISQYTVGLEYRGFNLAKIVDCSVETHDGLTIIYQGRDKDENLVFEAINAPIEVRYSPDK